MGELLVVSLFKSNNLSFLHSITSSVATLDPSIIVGENNHSAINFFSFRAEISLSCVNAFFYQLAKFLNA